MNGFQVETLIRRFCRDKFQGVYSCDTLPPKPELLVCNTDPHDKPGTHWIAIYVDKNGRGEYFDSFGMEPPVVAVRLRRRARERRFAGSTPISAGTTPRGQPTLLSIRW